jgi:hypothetical protein
LDAPDHEPQGSQDGADQGDVEKAGPERGHSRTAHRRTMPAAAIQSPKLSRNQSIHAVRLFVAGPDALIAARQ